MYIREILCKEEEKHRLRYIGLIDEWEGILREAEKKFDSFDMPFMKAKEQLLDLFYSSILHYDKFIRDEKTSNAHLKRHHFKKTETYISSLKRGKAALDQELKTPAGISFAWHFSNRMYDEMYDSFCRSSMLIKTPQNTDAYFFSESAKTYPLVMNQIVYRLSSDDTSFWDVNARYMQDLSRTVVNYILQRTDDYDFSDLIKDQTWSDAYLVLRDRLVEKKGNVPVFANGRDFRNYLIKVCKLLAGNIQRKYMQNNEYLDDLLQIQTDDDSEDEADSDLLIADEVDDDSLESETYVLNINTDNPYEVAHAVSIILLNSKHPYHKSLTDGIEDKVKVLIDKAINEMSYQDIISEQFEGKKINEDDYNRAVVKARKDYERVRKTLCDRLINLVNKNKM